MHCLYTLRFTTKTVSRMGGDAAMACQVMGKGSVTSVRVCVGRGPEDTSLSTRTPRTRSRLTS